MHEERQKEYSIKALQQISKDALAIATELRDPGDGPEKKEVLRSLRPTIMTLLVGWSKSTRRPAIGSADHKIFKIIYGARAACGFSEVRRTLVVQFARKATVLQFSPESDRRIATTKFFQKLGEKAGEEMEKLFPEKEELAL